MSIQRISAIVEKDIKEFLKNPMLYFLPFTSIFLAFMYSRLSTFDETESLSFPVYIIVGITFATVTANVMMTFMAEEHEKDTLQGLMLSPASFIDLLVGKSIVTTFFTIVTLLLAFFIMGAAPELTVISVSGLFLLFLFFLFLGIGVGLFVQSVGMTIAYSLPILIIFGFSPFIDLLLANDYEIVETVTSYLPLSLLIDGVFSNTMINVLWMSIWTVFAAIFMIICFQMAKRKE